MVQIVEDHEHEQRENLFQSRCLINGNTHSFIIDSGSCTNVIAQYVVNSLKLPTQVHPKPYNFNWLNDGSGMWGE